MLDKLYRIPSKEISCPGCGQKYGHHNTSVCPDCQECSKCCVDSKRALQLDSCNKENYMSAKKYIEEILGYVPYTYFIKK